MEPITSDVILTRLREASEEKKVKQYNHLCTVVGVMVNNLEAIVHLIALSGELHINLLDRKKVDGIIDPYYKEDPKTYSRVSHTASIHTGMTHLAGNAHICTDDAGRETVQIVATFKFKQEFVQSRLLPKILEIALVELVRFDAYFRAVHFEVDDGQRSLIKKDRQGWRVDSEVRDNSIVFTLSEGKNK